MGVLSPDVTVAMMSTQQLCVPAWNLERNREIGAWVNQRAVGKKVRIRGSGEGREECIAEMAGFCRSGKLGKEKPMNRASLGLGAEWQEHSTRGGWGQHRGGECSHNGAGLT